MNQVEQQIESARRTLYELDSVNGNIIGKSKLYKMYERNAADYAKARSDYAVAYAKAQSDPASLQAWPLTGKTYQQVVDSAWDDWVSAGKVKVESALAVIHICGNSPETEVRQQQN
jgi:hypothetical protein